jgi:hypothetical protein
MTWKPVLLVLLLVGCQASVPGAEGVTPAEEEQSAGAERVVQLQFDAYNRHDVEAFVGAHARGVQFYRYPDTLRISGQDSLRARIAGLFASAPQLHATVDARMTHGNIVVWKETVTGLPDGKTNTGITVCEVMPTRLLGSRSYPDLWLEVDGRVQWFGQPSRLELAEETIR